MPGRLSWPLVTLAVVGIGLYLFAIARYLAVYRTRRSGLLLGFVVAFALLAEALVAVALSRSWQASWWEWHVLMLAAFGLIALTAHREWHVERFSGLYRDETVESSRQVTVLFADLQGFTSYSERHDPGEVTEMLNALFEAALPAVERHGGEIDRLIGDAVMATSTGTAIRRITPSVVRVRHSTSSVRNPPSPRPTRTGRASEPV